MKILVLLIAVFLFAGSFEQALAQENIKTPEIKSKTWFNAESYNKPGIKVLFGKVILLFFWTAGDSNCDNAASILNEWYLRYKEKGFEIIGGYGPEWESDASEKQAIKKIKALGIKFPVTMDLDSSIRRAYELYSWPSFCLVDREGVIRARYEGQFRYDAMQIMLEALLEEGWSKRFSTDKLRLIEARNP